MFSSSAGRNMGTSSCILATFLAILFIACENEAKSDEDSTDVSLLMFETCPCLPSIVCPHVYGSNPEDEKYFGTVLKCERPEDVRCCGASTSVVTSKAILPVNLPEEYQTLVEPSPSVTDLPMEIVTAEKPEVETTTATPDVSTTIGVTTTERAPLATTSLYKHEQPVTDEGRAAKFSAEEIESMKKRLREMLKQRANPDLVVEESRLRKTYQSTEAATTSATTTRRGRFSKKDKSTTTATTLETRAPIVLMHKFDTRNRQNFLKTSRATTTVPTTPPTTTTTTESMDFEDDEGSDEDDDSQPDTVVAESLNVQQVVEAPKQPEKTSLTRGRMRYGMGKGVTSTTSSPRTRKTRTTRTPNKTVENSHAMKMAILEDINHQISEKRAPKDFKESMLLDFYFEKEEEREPALATTERSKRAQPVYESGFVPMIFA